VASQRPAMHQSQEDEGLTSINDDDSLFELPLVDTTMYPLQIDDPIRFRSVPLSDLSVVGFRSTTAHRSTMTVLSIRLAGNTAVPQASHVPFRSLLRDSRRGMTFSVLAFHCRVVLSLRRWLSMT
jgi:hypothetical protein